MKWRETGEAVSPNDKSLRVEEGGGGGEGATVFDQAA